VTSSLAGLDMSVLLPAWLPHDQMEVVGTGKGSVRGSGPEYWEDVSLAPLAAGNGAPAWTVRTLARRGCRPGWDGGWTMDAPFARAAGTAVTSLLLEQIPYGLPYEETRRRANQAVDTGDAVGEQLMDEQAWTRETAVVDGHAFVLWLHRRLEGFAAVADLGPCALVMHGRTPPDEWSFTLLAPDAARAALDRTPAS
jgi:hypothetical protein